MPPGSRNLDLFQTRKCHFPHPSSDQTSKIHTRFFRPGLKAKIMSSLLKSERKKKKTTTILQMRFDMHLSISLLFISVELNYIC